MNPEHFNPFSLSADAVALSALVGWWVGVLPAIATTLTVCWITYCFIKEFVRIYKQHKKDKKR